MLDKMRYVLLCGTIFNYVSIVILVKFCHYKMVIDSDKTYHCLFLSCYKTKLMLSHYHHKVE